MEALIAKYADYLPPEAIFKIMKHLIKKAKKAEEHEEDPSEYLNTLHSLIEDWFTLKQSSLPSLSTR